MKKQLRAKKLSLHRETLRRLDGRALRGVAGGAMLGAAATTAGNSCPLDTITCPEKCTTTFDDPLYTIGCPESVLVVCAYR